MSNNLIDQLLKFLPTESNDDGWQTLPSEMYATIYASRDGVMLTVPGVEAFKIDGDILVAKTHKNGTYAVAFESIFSVSLDEPSSHERKAGFAV